MKEQGTEKYRKTEHGGDWSGFFVERGLLPLDFSANVSPLGLPPAAREALFALLSSTEKNSLPMSDTVACPDLTAYPDHSCRALRRAIASKYGVSDEQVFCANGAADIIYRLAFALRPARALLIAPDFGEYVSALESVGTKITHFRPTRDFGMDRMWTDETENMYMQQITPETDLVIFSNPNNPSGIVMQPVFTDRILDRCIACGALLVVDECFMDFLPDGEERTMLRRLQDSGGRLMVLRAFTKFYGMAGLRLGWCAASSDRLLSALSRFGPPWQVSTAAQTAGVAALADVDYEKELRELILRERSYVTEELRRRGYRVALGMANYILFYSEDTTLHERLLAQGIMIRDCRNYPGLAPGWYRIAVRTHAENEVLLGYL